MLETYREVNRQNAENLEDAWDFVVVHDPPDRRRGPTRDDDHGAGAVP